MNEVREPTRARSVRWLRRRVQLFAFLDEAGPLTALYALLFADRGISHGQISSVFVLWAGVGLALEVPSGALADRWDRRRLIALALGIRAVGIALWLLWPTYAGVMLGAGLWAAHSALASGAWEAMVHDQLAALGGEDDYAETMARAGQASVLGLALGTLLGGRALGWGVSLEVLGWCTVGLHALSAPLILSLPRLARDASERPDAAGALRGWWDTLVAGVGHARRIPGLGGWILLGALLEGMFVVDEYVPLLARDRGAPDAWVPYAMVAIYVGVVAGDEVVARWRRRRARPIAAILAGGVLVTLIALLGEGRELLLLVGVGYAAHEVAWVYADARMQAVAPPETRATVTSVRALGSALVGMGAFALVGAFASGSGPGIAIGLAVALGALLVAALGMARLGGGVEEDAR